MKKLLFILLLLPFLSKGQTVGHFRYDTAKFYKQGGVTVLKVEGAIQIGQNPTYTTTSSASAIGQSFTLGTISSDQTITFPSLEPGRAGTFIFVDNINNSAFAWNVVGPVLERNPSGSFPVSVLPTGLHIFRWDGTNWNRLGSGGGASDSTQYTSPIAVDYDNPDYRRVYLDFPAFPQDTIGVVKHNDSLFNIHYPFGGPRDSTFIVDLDDYGGGDFSLSFDSVGVGKASLISENDVLRTRLFKNTYALIWDTALDRSMVLNIDTTIISTRAWRKKGSDSLAALISNKITQNGDSFGADMRIGTNDADGSSNGYKVLFESKNTEIARFYQNSSGGNFFLFGTTSQPGADGAGVTSAMSVNGGIQTTDRIYTESYLAVGTTAASGIRISQTDDTRPGMYAIAAGGLNLKSILTATTSPYSFLGSLGNTQRIWGSGTANYKFSLGYTGSNISGTSIADIAQFNPNYNITGTNGIDTSNIISVRPTYTSLTTGGKTAVINAIRVYEGETTIRGLTLGSSGDKIKIATGSNASVGTATLVAGTVTVNTTAVTASSRIFVTVSTPGGTQGFLSIGTITANTSFVVNSTNAADTSTFSYWIIN